MCLSQCLPRTRPSLPRWPCSPLPPVPSLFRTSLATCTLTLCTTPAASQVLPAHDPGSYGANTHTRVTIDVAHLPPAHLHGFDPHAVYFSRRARPPAFVLPPPLHFLAFAGVCWRRLVKYIHCTQYIDRDSLHHWTVDIFVQQIWFHSRLDRGMFGILYIYYAQLGAFARVQFRCHSSFCCCDPLYRHCFLLRLACRLLAFLFRCHPLHLSPAVAKCRLLPASYHKFLPTRFRPLHEVLPPTSIHLACVLHAVTLKQAFCSQQLHITSAHGRSAGHASQ